MGVCEVFWSRIQMRHSRISYFGVFVEFGEAARGRVCSILELNPDATLAYSVVFVESVEAARVFAPDVWRGRVNLFLPSPAVSVFDGRGRAGQYAALGP